MKHYAYRWLVLNMCFPLVLIAGCGSSEPVEDEAAVRKRQVYDETPVSDPGPSADLAADRDRMWRTVPSVGSPPSDAEVSPVSAINAAARVFAAVRPEGMKWEEAADLIGFRRRPGYEYDFPFWPVEGRVVVFRFDCGSYGWQFDLVFDAADRVAEVKRQWIH